jgi:acyl carrier protein
MNIQTFITDFIDELDDELITTLEPEAKFRELDAWDSLTALSIMAMLDLKYKVNLTADEMQSANTLGELYSLIENKSK